MRKEIKRTDIIRILTTRGQNSGVGGAPVKENVSVSLIPPGKTLQGNVEFFD